LSAGFADGAKLRCKCEHRDAKNDNESHFKEGLREDGRYAVLHISAAVRACAPRFLDHVRERSDPKRHADGVQGAGRKNGRHQARR
jgi:hypothetical protein